MIHIITIISLITLFFSSCEYDNYDAPSITFSGQLLDSDGQKFLYDGNSNKPILNLIQKGYGKIDGGTTVQVNEQGAFSQLLFEGEYWLTLKNNQYPFEFKDFKSLGVGLGYDSIHINVNGSINRNFEVTPYYLISDYTLKEDNGEIVANFKVSKNPKITADIPKVVRARLFVGTASIVNSATTCTKSKIVSITSEGSVEVRVSIASGDNSYRKIYVNNYRDYAFCRVGVEVNGIADYYLFSETKKIEHLTQ